MSLDRMFSRLLRNIESTITREASKVATKKVSNVFNKEKEKTPQEDVVEKPANDKAEIIIASAYVGFAASFADGELDAKEAEAIDKFKSQLDAEGADDLAIEIIKIKGEKPSFEKAMSHVDKFPVDMLSFFEGLIEDILKADGEVSDAEQAFLSKWENYKKGRLQ